MLEVKRRISSEGEEVKWMEKIAGEGIIGVLKKNALIIVLFFLIVVVILSIMIIKRRIAGARENLFGTSNT